MKALEPLEQAAAEYADERTSSAVLGESMRAAYMAGAEHALRIARQPGGVDRLRQEIVEHGRLLGTRATA